MRKKIDKLMLAILDTFLIVYFPLWTCYLFKKNGITNPNIMESLGFIFILFLMPAICKYLALKIDKEKENIGRQILDSLFHIMSGYIVFFIMLSFITNYTKSPIIVSLTIVSMLIIMYLLFGEYNFSIGITTEEEKVQKHIITKEVLKNKDVHELLVDKKYDEAEITLKFDVVRNKKGKLDINIDNIEVIKKGEVIEEDESFKESDK